LANAHENYEVPRWKGQLYYTEVWCEKMAMYSILEHILQDMHVPIQINRGEPSYTLLFEAYLRFKHIYETTLQFIRILYLGDWDPDGDMMDEVIVDRLNDFVRRFGHVPIFFERVAVLEEHETAFGITLPSDPNRIMFEQDKAGKPRYKNVPRFFERYRRVAQIEIDALTSTKVLPKFKSLLRKHVDYDWRGDGLDPIIYDERTGQVQDSQWWIDRFDQNTYNKEVIDAKQTPDAANKELLKLYTLTALGKKAVKEIDKRIKDIEKEEAQERKERSEHMDKQREHLQGGAQ